MCVYILLSNLKEHRTQLVHAQSYNKHVCVHMCVCVCVCACVRYGRSPEVHRPPTERASSEVATHNVHNNIIVVI